ncbi:transposase [Mesorhizobium sp. WSM4976]|uniref:transposase n=1 Tax=Mesorhizobium sp. WSM4976 TaxID=3038549 RepID=UPI0024160B27|nr:transposase [Mesorhizobium sp. WSM4976]MDG4892731.1 transposase [Mesorhizobium sp. WSM4976]
MAYWRVTATSTAWSPTRKRNWSHYDWRAGETFSTNHVESFWVLFKRSVRSTHIHVSSKHMHRYLDEFTFRSNHREMQNAMFDLIVARV